MAAPQRPFRAISYGGGVQSTAMIVLACTGRIDADVALFCDVGDDSEHPATLAYVRDVAVPWAAEHGLDIQKLRRADSDGVNQPDLYRTMVDYRGEATKEPIPVRGMNGAPFRRSCTADWKVGVMQRWLRDNDHLPATSLIGISVDELERAGRGPDDAGFTREYPLLAVDINLTRADCEQVIRRAGLPVPPKSACYFCPFHKPQTWAEMRRDEPDLFAKAQGLEDVLIDRRAALGMDPVYLTRFGRRLTDAVPVAQDSLFPVDWGTDIGEDGCDEGVCFV